MSLVFHKRKSLFPYQEKALAYAQSRSRIALFMEMRLGKTLVCIRWLSNKTGPFLIVAPVEALAGWEHELRGERVNPLHIAVLYGTKQQRLKRLSETDNRSWCLINYEGLRVIDKDIRNMPWGAVVLDESTRIRNPKAGVTKYCLSAFSNIRHRAILTGLPDPEGPTDYYCQLSFLNGGFLGCHNYWMFRHKFFKTDARGWNWEPKAGIIDRIKREVHDLSFILTRDKANIGSKKLYQRRVVEMTPAQTKLYNQVKNEFAYEEQETKWVITQVLWLSRIAGGFNADGTELVSKKKMNELLRLLNEDLKNDQAIVWFRFNSELRSACSQMSDVGISCESITGSVDKKLRPDIVKRFQSGKFRVLAMQVKCGRFGLDCSAADTAIYYSNPYDGEDRAQTEDRIVHPKKKNPLLLIDLISRNSIDEDVIRILKDKRQSSRQFMRAVITDLVSQWRMHKRGHKSSYVDTQSVSNNVRRLFP